MNVIKLDVAVSKLFENAAEEIAELFRKVWIENANEYPVEWRKRRALTKDQIVQEMREDYQYFGIRVNNKLVGTYKILVTPYGLFGEHQSVDPRYRKMGLATAMYEHFTEYARQLNCKRVYVNILANQAASLKLIENMGFHKVGPEFSQAKDMKVQMYCKRI